jgi:hypothetical protein
MKQFLLTLAILALTANYLSAQNNVGIVTTAPNPSSNLDLTSTDKGF